jgi:SAM-dependent methyltransferase
MFSLRHLATIRKAEIERIVAHLAPGARILEIGAGTGEQAADLARRGFQVTAIEMAESGYAGDRIFPITNYDGRTIPLADASVDIVFSSNVLEHVPDLARMHAEIKRVLRPSGYCVHVMPTHAWRLWTTLSSYPDAVVGFVAALPDLVPHTLPNGAERGRLQRAWRQSGRRMIGTLMPRRHGERGNIVSELWLFHPSWWRKNFTDNGFAVLHDEPMELFYTGNMLLGSRLGLGRRQQLARWLGSACHLFKVAPTRT